ncbi:polysaccharide deacetylase family protein [Peribacillus kribbensis]|uniref:polysaccharide deacetylase family protein n=1 Tax=Peribacillus kribbensis TaxID=356658 RepID=UPI000402A701|nr:polysaccharide deacetylase family protein [Peribacillus kribbensis]
MKKHLTLLPIFLVCFLMSSCQNQVKTTETVNENPHTHIKKSHTDVLKQEREQKERDEKKKLLEQAAFSAQQYDYQRAMTLLNQSNYSRDPEIKSTVQTYQNEQKNLVKWPDNGKISHLFFHSLVVDESRAFDGDYMDRGYKDYMVTIEEFKKILQQVYDRGYVLVNIQDIAKPDPKGNMVYQSIYLPQGKKPLVLSQDDVSYYEYMKNDGFAQNLTLDANTNVTNTYQDKTGKVVQGPYDMVPLVDAFVNLHPDFSYRGAKGIIALTGYNGVLGYRTSESSYGQNSDHPNPHLAEDRQKAKNVADEMKHNGWKFASHTWGHLNASQVSLNTLQRDTAKWRKEVEPIVGPVDTIIFAFGSDIGDWKPYSNDKFSYLRSQGFTYFCNVDASTVSWTQLGKNYFRQARINVDGLRMAEELAGKTKVLEPFFDVKLVYAPSRLK